MRLMVLYTNFLLVIDPLIEFFCSLYTEEEKNEFYFVYNQTKHVT